MVKTSKSVSVFARNQTGNPKIESDQTGIYHNDKGTEIKSQGRH